MNEKCSRIVKPINKQVKNQVSDLIREISLFSRDELEAELGVKLGKTNLLITYHTETLSEMKPEDQISELLTALAHFKDVSLFFTSPNAVS